MQANIETLRQTSIQAGRRADIHTGRQADIQTGIHPYTRGCTTHTHTYRENPIYTYIQAYEHTSIQAKPHTYCQMGTRTNKNAVACRQTHIHSDTHTESNTYINTERARYTYIQRGIPNGIHTNIPAPIRAYRYTHKHSAIQTSAQA